MNNFEEQLNKGVDLDLIEKSIKSHDAIMQFVFLRAIIDAWLSSNLSNDDFLNDMQVLLGERTVSAVDITEYN